MDAVQIDLGNVAGVEAIAADFDDVVVVGQVGFGKFKHRLGLKRLDEHRAQVKEQIAFKILVQRSGDLRALLRTLQAQFPFVVPFVQIAEVGRELRAGEWPPDSFIASGLSSIRRQGELRIGTEKSGDFLRLHLVHAEGIGLESGVGGFKLRLYLVPGEALLR